MLRESKIVEQMELLGIKDITTNRQARNGTVIWQLPIKKYGQFIEVGSFKSGYVRRMNGGYTPYQLNKTEKFDHYYKMYDYSNDNSPKFNGNYRKHECVKRILIPNEVDRLEYLIAFCLKNYYINQANMIEDGKFIPKWKYEMEVQGCKNMETSARVYQDKVIEYEEVIRELQRKLDGINGMSVDAYNNGFNDGKQEPEVSVTVNGHRYKVI